MSRWRRAIWWDHNAWYHRLLLRQLPDRPLGTVLDVGCGAGELAATLARRAGHVDAVDRSPRMVELARAAVPRGVVVRLADIERLDLPDAHYDAVLSVSALHHLDLAGLLPRLAASVKPGGVIAAVALPRVDLPRELPIELAALAADRALGTAWWLEGRWRKKQRRFVPAVHHLDMPMRDGELTTREVRAVARGVLPGVTVQRRLLWRYLLVWHKLKSA